MAARFRRRRSKIAAPDHVRAGEPFSVKLLVRSKTAGAATVELLRDSQPLTTNGDAALVAGENHKSFPAVVLEAVAGRLFGPRQSPSSRRVARR